MWHDFITAVQRIDVAALDRGELGDLAGNVGSVRAVLDGLEARIAVAMRGLGASDATTAETLRRRTGCSAREARHRARRAETLQQMPNVAEALSAGRITGEHATALARAAAETSPEAVDGDAALLAAAEAVPADLASHKTRDWTRRHQTGDDLNRLHLWQRRNRSLNFTEGHGGMLNGIAKFDRVSGAQFQTLVDALADRLYRADGGRDNPDARTRAQCRLDALLALVGIEPTPLSTDGHHHGGGETAVAAGDMHTDRLRPPRIERLPAMVGGRAEGDDGEGRAQSDVGRGRVQRDDGGGRAEVDVGRGRVQGDDGRGRAEGDDGEGRAHSDDGRGRAEPDGASGHAEADVGTGRTEPDGGGGHVHGDGGGGRAEPDGASGHAEADVGRGRADGLESDREKPGPLPVLVGGDGAGQRGAGRDAGTNGNTQAGPPLSDGESSAVLGDRLAVDGVTVVGSPVARPGRTVGAAVWPGCTCGRGLGVRGQLSIVVDVPYLASNGEQGRCEIPGIGEIARSELERRACDADIYGLIFSSDGLPLNHGRKTRTVSPQQWRVLVARDRGCVICGARPDWCQAHHVKPWLWGGRTDLDNLALVCHGHHRWIHDNDITLRRGPNGWRAPPGVPMPRAPALAGH